MQAYLDRLTDSQAQGFINKIGDVFKPLPKLPAGLVEFLVKIAPYLAILSVIMTLIGGPLVGLLGSFAAVLTGSPMFLIWTIVTVVLMLAQAALMLLAFKPLQNRQMKGWMYLFWAELISFVHVILDILQDRPSSLIVSLFFFVLWFYILFQMRPSYSKLA